MSKTLGVLIKNPVLLKLQNAVEKLPKSQDQTQIQTFLMNWRLPVSDAQATEFLKKMISLGDLRLKAKSEDLGSAFKRVHSTYSDELKRKAVELADKVKDDAIVVRELFTNPKSLGDWRMRILYPRKDVLSRPSQEEIVSAANAVGLDLNREKIRRILYYALGNIDFLAIPPKGIQTLPGLSKTLGESIENPVLLKLQNELEKLPESQDQVQIKSFLADWTVSDNDEQAIEFLNNLIRMGDLRIENLQKNGIYPLKMKSNHTVDPETKKRTVMFADAIDNNAEAAEQLFIGHLSISEWRARLKANKLFDEQDVASITATLGIDLEAIKVQRIIAYAMGEFDFIRKPAKGISPSPQLSQALKKHLKSFELGIMEEAPKFKNKKRVQTLVEMPDLSDGQAAELLGHFIRLGDSRIENLEEILGSAFRKKRIRFNLKQKKKFVILADVLKNDNRVSQAILVHKPSISKWRTQLRALGFLDSKHIALSASIAGLDLDMEKVRRIFDYFQGITDIAPSFPRDGLQPSPELTQALKKFMEPPEVLSQLRHIAARIHNLSNICNKSGFSPESFLDIWSPKLSDEQAVEFLNNLAHLGNWRISTQQRIHGYNFDEKPILFTPDFQRKAVIFANELESDYHASLELLIREHHIPTWRKITVD